MKRILLSIAVVVGLVGCASNPQTTIKQTQDSIKPENKYERATTQVANLKVPDWFIQPPKATEQSMFTAGQATSTDLSMAVHKAILDADSKLSFQMKSRVDAMVKSYKADSTTSGAESTTMLARKLTRTSITGHHQVDSQITQEGRMFRVFVLMRYPLGDANKLLAEENDTKARRAMNSGSRNALKEMNDGNDKAERREYEQDNNIAPQSKVEPVEAEPQKPAVTGGITLLNVDNAEYKAKRDVALQKPGAVIGQSTIR